MGCLRRTPLLVVERQAASRQRKLGAGYVATMFESRRAHGDPERALARLVSGRPQSRGATAKINRAVGAASQYWRPTAVIQSKFLSHAPLRAVVPAKGCLPLTPPLLVERQSVLGGGAVWGGEEHRPGVGARRALREHLCRILFERSERSERSELCGTTPGRAPQRSRRAAATAAVCAPAEHRLPRRAQLCPANLP